ncbi:MAG: DNA gyrase subunit A [Coriobacteriales bacterium]|nr:DNA gyrase subunit A [Coriobacteriales bacterium]
MADNITQSMDLSGSQIEPAEISREMRSSFLEYSMSVIVARALPDVRDGLKPVHRRILYAMNESGITPGRPHKKSAWAVGEVLGKYHPHGDAAVYDTMVRMAQDFSMRVPLIDGHGNFGSVDGDSAAHMRYTEARLQRVAMELLRDLDKDTVDFQPNYDESLTEPSVLPARFPNLLTNGSQGIAVGMATNIPPHNLGELIDAVDILLERPDATIEELMQVLPGPDFPTGALVMGKQGIRDYFMTGRGSLILRARARLEKTSSGRDRIIFDELPYMVNKAKLEEKLEELRRDKKLPDVALVRDESDRKGMRLMVELRPGAIPQVSLNQIYKHTQAQNSFGVIMLALVDGVPRTLNIKEALTYYIKHQEEVVVRRTRFDLKKAEERAHILAGLMIALENIDEVIAIIRASQDDSEAKVALMDRFGLSEPQTEAILEMRLRRLTGLEREKLENELDELLDKIAWYRQVLSDNNLVHQIIKEELDEIKQRYATPRRTELAADAKDLEVEDLIAEEDMVVTITRSGYVKRLPVATYRQQKRGGKGLQGVNLKDDDFVENLFIASTHDYMLFFSTRGKVYRLKVHELPVGSRTARGSAVVNLLPFEAGEKIAAVIATKDFPADEYLLFATESGMVKKTAMNAYTNTRANGLIAINLRSDDALIAVRRVKLGEKVVMVSSDGKAIRFDASEIRAMGRDTSGVIGMKPGPEARVLGMEIAPPHSDLFVITENGYGKRTPIEEYTEHHRGGQGIATIAMTEKKGRLAGMKIVLPGHELMIVSEEGVVIRVKATDVSQQGRATQGVKVMNVSDTDRVCAVARVIGTKKMANTGALETAESDFDESEEGNNGDGNGDENGDVGEYGGENDAGDAGGGENGASGEYGGENDAGGFNGASGENGNSTSDDLIEQLERQAFATDESSEQNEQTERTGEQASLFSESPQAQAKPWQEDLDEPDRWGDGLDEDTDWTVDGLAEEASSEDD